MLGRRSTAADGDAVDAYSLAPLLPGLEVAVDTALFCGDFGQGVGDPSQLLLFRFVSFIHGLGQVSLHHVVAVGILGGGLVYHGDDLPQ